MEILDIYDDNGILTGKTIIRGDKRVLLNEGEHIALSVIFIENEKGEYLIQKTSKEKGGEFSSTGGHVDGGETPLEAIKREVKEELGINIDNELIMELGYVLYDMPLRYIFCLKKDINIDDIKVQKEEVDYVTYMTISEVEEKIKNNEFLKSHGIMFKEMLKRKDDKNVRY